MSDNETKATRSRIQETMVRHRSVLNRLEPHLGCVTCRGPLTDGRCPACDPVSRSDDV